MMLKPLNPSAAMATGIPTIHRGQFTVDNSLPTIHRRIIDRGTSERRTINLRTIDRREN